MARNVIRSEVYDYSLKNAYKIFTNYYICSAIFHIRKTKNAHVM